MVVGRQHIYILIDVVFNQLMFERGRWVQYMQRNKYILKKKINTRNDDKKYQFRVQHGRLLAVRGPTCDWNYKRKKWCDKKVAGHILEGKYVPETAENNS
jgi:hypothetical protein